MSSTINSPVFGPTRKANEHELHEIERMCREIPVAMFQGLNKAFNARGFCIAIATTGEAPPPAPKFPDGKLNAEDQGESLLAVSTEQGRVRIDFETPSAWIAMPPDQAMNFAEALLKHARAARN